MNIGRYKIDEVLEESTTITSFLASVGSRRFIIKQLYSHFAEDTLVRERFMREVKSYQLLKHSNIISFVESLDDDVAPSAVFEYAGGGTLRERIPVRAEDAVSIAEGVARALVHTHAVGVVHRDIRPENIFFGEADGVESVKLGGFGAAHVDDLVGLTTSTLLSTNSRYLAPEVLAGNTRDPRSDIYSLGAVLFESLTGTEYRPSTGAAENRLREHSTEPWFCELVEHLLRSLDSRPVSAGEVVRRIQRRSIPSAAEDRSCIHCHATTPRTLPVCIHCGGEDVFAETTTAGDGEALVLKKLSEEDAIFDDFLFLLRCLSGDDNLHVNIITGDIRMYSKAEKASGVRLPARILDNLTVASATNLAKLFERSGSTKIHVYRRSMSQLRSREKRGPLITPKTRPSVKSDDIARLADQLKAVAGQEKTPGIEVHRRTIEKGFAIRNELTSLSVDTSFGELLSHTLDLSASLLGECEKVTTFLSGVDLTRLYADMHDIEARIEIAEGGAETQRLVSAKIELLELFDRYRDRERRLSGSVTALCRVQTVFDEILERLIDLRDETNSESGAEQSMNRRNTESVVNDLLVRLGRELQQILVTDI